MIRCNNCGRIYTDDSELPKILDIMERDYDGDFRTVDRCIYEGQEVEITESHYEEVFNGCGSCCCDNFLMDIDKDSDGFNDAQIEEIWEMFTDVPIDESERLERQNMIYGSGLMNITVKVFMNWYIRKVTYYECRIGKND